MRCLIVVVVFSTLMPSLLLGETALIAPNLTIGKNLEAVATITLSKPAPDGGVDITLRSNDPARLRISRTPDQAGVSTFVLRVREGFRESPEFWIHALDSSGTATYSATAPAFADGVGTVNLTPSAIIITGPVKTSAVVTTPRAEPTKLRLSSARLDASFQYVEEQPIAGGLSAQVGVLSSSEATGTILRSPVELRPGTSAAVTQFQPAQEGDTTVRVSLPEGFSVPAQFASLKVTVQRPGLGLSDQVAIGQNLQIGGVLSLGEPAPDNGVNVTIVSEDPSQLLLAETESAVGSKSITLKVPSGQSSARYYLQALGNGVTVSYTGTAPGYRSRSAKVLLAPSGVIITPVSRIPSGPPDAIRKAPDNDSTLTTRLSDLGPALVAVWTVQLDPATHRSGTIGIQPVRAGFSISVELANSNPAVGTVAREVIIKAASDHSTAEFKPLSPGSSKISLVTPKILTPVANSTPVTAYVRE